MILFLDNILPKNNRKERLMKNIKRVLAIGMIIVLVAMYIWAFIASLMTGPESKGIFNAAIFCTVFFPILLYVYMWTAKWLKGRGTDKGDKPFEEDTKDKDKSNK